MTPGIRLIHKPPGPTSFSIVQHFLEAARATALQRPSRVCHGGTLDPFAEGLMLILIEPATRLFDYLHDIPKTYEATIRWGIETDNGDPLGRAIFTGDASELSPRRLDEALAAMGGWHLQIPPVFSAKRVEGERAYARAHRGENINLPPVNVYLHEARWLSHDLPTQSRVRLTVRGGYYVRSLARELGRSLGCGAHIASLCRTSIGPWNDPACDDSPFNLSPVITGVDLLPWLSRRTLSDQDVGDLRARKQINTGTLIPPDWSAPHGFPAPRPLVRAFHMGKFCFLLEPIENRLRLLSPLRGGL